MPPFGAFDRQPRLGPQKVAHGGCSLDAGESIVSLWRRCLLLRDVLEDFLGSELLHVLGAMLYFIDDIP